MHALPNSIGGDGDDDMMRQDEATQLTSTSTAGEKGEGAGDIGRAVRAVWCVVSFGSYRT